MILRRLGFVSLLSFALLIDPLMAHGIEDGAEAVGNEIVVPIQVRYNATQSLTCTGALISSYVVATAGHCLLDES